MYTNLKPELTGWSMDTSPEKASQQNSGKVVRVKSIAYYKMEKRIKVEQIAEQIASAISATNVASSEIFISGGVSDLNQSDVVEEEMKTDELRMLQVELRIQLQSERMSKDLDDRRHASDASEVFVSLSNRIELPQPVLNRQTKATLMHEAKENKSNHQTQVISSRPKKKRKHKAVCILL